VIEADMTIQRLNNKTISELSPEIALPRYDRKQLDGMIVHLGIGAFHRAHQAWYTDAALNLCGGRWGIIGASLRSARVKEHLQPQDYLYTVAVNGADKQQLSVVGAVKDVIVAPEEPERLVGALSDAKTQVVTLTITEKAYCYNLASDDLDWENEDLQHDLRHFTTAPKTALGYLVAAFSRRRKNNAPLTVISCDNLPDNGHILEKAVLAFSRKVDPELVQWISEFVAFPCSMVDRIVPATTEEDVQALGRRTGLLDEAAVVTEAFSQWVIEKRFCTELPPWDEVGALYVDDVKPFEEMKLRLLNGSHSIIAYLGFITGYDYVHEVVADPVFAEFVRRYMDEMATPTLDLPEGFDVEAYKEQLMARFANSALNHKTAQIAQDGSQKIPQRWLLALSTLRDQGKDVSIFEIAVAAWLRYLLAYRESGEAFGIVDPEGPELVRRIQQSSLPYEQVQAILGYEKIFDSHLLATGDFLKNVAAFYQEMLEQGCAQCLANFLFPTK
jgi:fructuronate reductase